MEGARAGEVLDLVDVLVAAIVAVAGMPSEYLLVIALPRASITAKEVKFSKAMSSMPRHWRRFSFSMRSWISGSTAARGVFPHSDTASMTGIGGGGMEVVSLDQCLPERACQLIDLN